MVRDVKAVLVGFGNVGRALTKLLAVKGELIEHRYGVRIKVVAIVDSKGAALSEEGFTRYELLKLCELPRGHISQSSYGLPHIGVRELYSRLQPDIHVEITPSNYDDGEPGLSHIITALKNGIHVVTANKAPLVLAYKRLLNLASKRKLQLRFKATVMAGTPIIDLLNSLKGYIVNEVEGILNGTTNYILTEMHENLISFNEALRKAQILGIAESNPELDLNGLDAAAKLVIISNVIQKPVKLNEIFRESVSNVDIREIYKSIKAGVVIKYIAHLDFSKGEYYVKLKKIPRDSFFGLIDGSLNAIKIMTDINDIFICGKGAGGMETAHSILDDILNIALYDGGDVDGKVCG